MKKWAKLWIFVAWSLALAHAMVPHHHHTGNATDACSQNQNPVSDFFADIDLGDDHLNKYNAPNFIGILSEAPALSAPVPHSTAVPTPSSHRLWTTSKPAGPLLRGPPVSA